MDLNDGLSNVVTGLGIQGMTKRASAMFSMFMPRSRIELDNAYRGSWLARAAVDMPTEDAFGPSRMWQADTDTIAKIEAEERRLKLGEKLVLSEKRASKDGGAAILMDDGGDTTEPLDVARIGLGGLRTLTALSRWELTEGDIDRDIQSPGYGLPMEWRVNSLTDQVTVHPSRLIFFKGEDTLSDAGFGFNSVWGDSYLDCRMEAIQDAESAIGNTAELIYEANVDILAIKDMMNSLASDPQFEARMLERLRLFRLGKSTSKVAVRDTEEEYDRKAVNFGALPELLREMMQIASGAVQIPATRLLGRAPAGMNSTGDGDERVYFDRLDAKRDKARETLMPLDEALIRSAIGNRPEELTYTWPALRQVSDKEKAENVDKITSAIEKLVRSGLFTQEEARATAAAMLIQAELAPGLEAAMAETEAGGDFDLGGEDDPGEEENRQSANDAEPRTLYVRRNVMNASEIITWAKGQGFKTTLPADDMHVTIAFSRTAVDWFKVGEAWESEVEVAEGGARMMAEFGQQGDAKVLLFASSHLSWRHEQIKEAGASWDHPEYQPHITISYDPEAPKIDAISPYAGKIILGPEIFEELNEDWKEGISEE